MSITDELRKYANGYQTTVNHRLLQIADHIDERHEEAVDKAYSDGIQDGIDADNGMREYMEPPKNAEGGYVHVGDVLEDERGERYTVDALTLTEHGWRGVQYALDLEGDTPLCFEHMRPYRASTVEELLVQFVCKVAGREYMTIRPEVIDEYAEKMQLRG